MPSSYAEVHRSNTSKRPYLALNLNPVRLSLTEGTPIPAPPEEIPTPPKTSPIVEEREEGKTTSSGQNQRGPLSSHPVTPVETANGSAEGVPGAFPFTKQDFAHSATGSTNRTVDNPYSSTMAPNGVRKENGVHNGVQHPTSNGTASSPLSQHQRNASTNTAIHDSQQPYSNDSSPNAPNSRRRPSFAERFLRLRSLSNFRNSWNGSKGSLSGQNPQQHANGTGQSRAVTPSGGLSRRASGELLSGPHSVAYARGMKRPASPSLEGSSVYSSTTGGESRPPKERVSQTFPRMMRKKSVEWFGTARRKSGFFGREDGPPPTDNIGVPDNDYAMEEEARRERMREELEREQSVDYRRTTDTVRKTPREPPPTIPEGEHLNELNGDEMFKNIGR